MMSSNIAGMQTRISLNEILFQPYADIHEEDENFTKLVTVLKFKILKISNHFLPCISIMQYRTVIICLDFLLKYKN